LRRPALLALVVGLASLSVPSAGRAGGAVVVPAGTSSASTLDARVAVAITPYGPARWSQITVAGTPRVLWLVPARPGAAIDWANDAWLSALDEATAVHVVPPTAAAPCVVPAGAEKAPPWLSSGQRKLASSFAVHTTEADVRGHAAAKGYGIPTELGSRIAALYAKSWALVSVEIDGVASTSMSRTLRVVDDGAPILPFALTGTSGADVKMTAFVIAADPARMPSTTDVDGKLLRWGPYGSQYAQWRAHELGNWGHTWFRESTSSRTLFLGHDADGTRVPSVAEGYYPICAADARNAGTRSGTVGRLCPPGSLGRVPGGSTCVDSDGNIPPWSFQCGQNADDLALALAGADPSTTVVTRFAGVIPKFGYGSDAAIWTNGTYGSTPVVRAADYDCAQTPSAPLTPPSAQGGSYGGRGTRTFRRTDSCSGGTTVIVVDDSEPPPDEGCGGSTTTAGASSSSPPSSSDSDDEGWDTDDDDEGYVASGSSSSGWDTSDSSSSSDCDGDSSSSSSSDSCDSDSSSSSSDSCDSGGGDGWDSPDMAPKKNSGLKKKNRGSSPVSRYALFFAALLLPLRRRTRLPRLD
jgi:hypothetical protein